MKIKTRIFIDAPLKENSTVAVSDNQLHHLVVVLRIATGEYVSVFNSGGEFLSKVSGIGKKEATLQVLNLMRTAVKADFHLHLAYAPLKKDANDFVLEKAVELGAHEITQVRTEYTVNKPLDADKISQKLILATQQCERLDVPAVNPHINLAKFLDKYKNSTIFWLYERGDGITMSQYLRENTDLREVIFLIGPEGGFSPAEVNLLQSLDFVKQVHFNTNILRAETAALAALINFQIISCNF
ncbi:MAG: 16S rRNA (uracil(1498)-N(3))-methyltransferase [Alphaproteobacteria bacterium]|jgi:16S rRNA (uracil1498-N3)-methyltransferase|nr:16S rRNA (uracil(1498)-N(3))-methyltransferase [Alphaproteobacteria bacterium]